MLPHKPKVRCRFSPSPTGGFHIGGARTALFNMLYALKNKGSFILRIEDTDKERSELQYEKEIYESLRWLGVDWQEGPDVGGEYGPYRQSERTQIYESYLKKMLDENKAYYCYCTKEELETERQAMLTQGLAPKYGGKCRELKTALKGREPQVIRFKMPETVIEFKDIIRTKVKFDMALVGDVVIAKNLNEPLYNFAVTVDDFLQKISHVIRGEEHIANTPKQVAFQRALNFDTPEYAHLPLILAPDRSKLSKRYSETSLIEYKKSGYLPQALINFIALLGWHPRDDREVLSLTDLVEEFDLSRVQKAGAVFSLDKLNWFNAIYIRNLKDAELEKVLEPYLRDAGIEVDSEELRRVIAVEKHRLKNLGEFVSLTRYYFKLPEYDVKTLIWQGTSADIVKENLTSVKNLLQGLPPGKFSKEELEKIVMPLAVKLGKGALLWPLRVALSGQEKSSGPFEIMEVLQKEKVLERINLAEEKLSHE